MSCKDLGRFKRRVRRRIAKMKAKICNAAAVKVLSESSGSEGEADGDE